MFIFQMDIKSQASHSSSETISKANPALVLPAKRIGSICYVYCAILKEFVLVGPP